MSDSSSAIALLRALNATQTPQDVLQRPATIQSYDSATNRALVVVDGDTAAVSMAVLLQTAPAAGDRVMVEFQRPRGAFVAKPI